MIQSSPQPQSTEALSGGAGRLRSAGTDKFRFGGAKKNDFASLFSSLLAEARSVADATSSMGAGKKKISEAEKGAEGKTSAPRLGDAQSVSAVRRASAKTAVAATSRRVVEKNESASAARTATAETAAKEIYAGKQAAAAAEKKTGAARASSEKVEEVAEGSRKALLARRRQGFQDGVEGVDGKDGPERHAAAMAAQRNPASVRRSDGRSDDAGESKAEGVETKKKDKRRERLEIELYDHRSSSPPSATEAAAGAGNVESPSSSDKTAVSEADLVVNLRSGAGERGGEESPRPGAANGTTFSDALARELRENANADIVKHASLVLKDGGEGLVRLSLKPESLGVVKIRLEMADNRIAGRILVESDEALKAFEKELASLEQAFRDGGFDGASLELAVSSDGARGGSGEGRGGEGPRPFFSERPASTYDAATVLVDDKVAGSLSESLVNVLA